MKNALLLHGVDGSSKDNWFPWLKTQLEDDGWRVWVPDLPNSAAPNAEAWTHHIFSNNQWVFNEESIVIGHSSGAVEILALLQHMPANTTIMAAFLVAAFTDELSKQEYWSMLRGLFTEPFDFDRIIKRSKKFVFLHSEDDPYCPPEQPKYLCAKLHGEMHMLSGKQHFSLGMDPSMDKLPELVTLINEATR